MRNLFNEVAGEVRGLQITELSAYITKMSAKKFYAKVCAIAELYNSGRYRETYSSVQEWAETEFGWNRKQVERYRSAHDLLSRLDNVSNWTFLPINELQCRILIEFDFDTGTLREAWAAVEEAVKAGAKLTGKLIEKACSVMVGSIEQNDPEHYRDVVERARPESPALPGVLEYRPEIPFAPFVLDWKENPGAELPPVVPGNKALVVNARNFPGVCEWAACRMDLEFLVICDFPGEYEEKTMPPNVWPGIAVNGQEGFEAALDIFSRTWSPAKWLWVNLRGPVNQIQINADWVAIREFYDLCSLGEILRDTQEAYIMPDAIQRHNKIPQKTFGILKETA